MMLTTMYVNILVHDYYYHFRTHVFHSLLFRTKFKRKISLVCKNLQIVTPTPYRGVKIIITSLY